jgi:transcriptional regulator with XRE-family HTH domain
MSVDIGGRLRFVRSRHKLSQRELAKRSGVTNSTISLIESNQMNPSVGALKRILDGIPMGLAEFFAIEPERRARRFIAPMNSPRSARSRSPTCRSATPCSVAQLQILREHYGPGGDTGACRWCMTARKAASSSRPARSDRRRRAPHPRAGDAYYFESRRPHRFRCIGNKPCEVISACTPPTF